MTKQASIGSILQSKLKYRGQQLGFQQIGITHHRTNLEEPKLQQWLDAGFHGEMEYMAAHGMKERGLPNYIQAPFG